MPSDGNHGIGTRVASPDAASGQSGRASASTTAGASSATRPAQRGDRKSTTAATANGTAMMETSVCSIEILLPVSSAQDAPR